MTHFILISHHIVVIGIISNYYFCNIPATFLPWSIFAIIGTVFNISESKEEKYLLIQAIKIRIKSGLDHVKDPSASELRKRLLKKWIRTYNKLGKEFNLTKEENLFGYTREEIYQLNAVFTEKDVKQIESHQEHLGTTDKIEWEVSFMAILLGR